MILLALILIVYIQPLGQEAKRPAKDYNCGYRCALYLLNHHEISHLPLDVLGSFPSDMQRKGCSISDIAQSLSSQGVHAAVRQRSLAELSECKHPVIVHLKAEAGAEIGHFAVLLSINSENEVQCWDGLLGRVSTDISAFESHYTGWCVVSQTDLSPALPLQATKILFWLCFALLVLFYIATIMRDCYSPLGKRKI